jgi:hypothetical protein
MLLLLRSREILRNAHAQKQTENDSAQCEQQQSPANVTRTDDKQQKSTPNAREQPDQNSRGIVDFQPRLT